MTSEKHIQILLDSIHFNNIRSAIRTRSVAWDALARSSEISDLDASVAKKLESVLIKHTDVNLTLAECIPSAIHLLKTAPNAEVKKYVYNLLSELLSSPQYAEPTVEYFAKNPTAVKDLFSVSIMGDDQSVLISSFNLVSLLIQPGLQNEKLVAKLLASERFVSVLQNLDHMDTSYVCIRLLQELCAVSEYRSVVWNAEEKYVPTLFYVVTKALESNSATRVAPTNSNNLAVQLQYYSLLTLWLLTFDTEIASELATKYLSDFLNLLKLVKVTIKEKISRLCIAIILNCVAPHVKSHKVIIRQLLLLGNALPVLQSLSERKYSDDELRNDLTSLKDILEETYKELTSFDEYVAELDSKMLVWSPPHVDNGFWSDNVDKFKDQDWKLFKKLVQLLKDANNEPSRKVAVQVALSDITHIVELLPESVDVLTKLDGKVVIMELLNHPDSKVKYEALKATQAFVAHTFK
ncbi:LAFE_0B10110g1_1 [Lachancea fermentati]|uniref:V-type proton ATPase subunit H n=1 Tax=Lachancea fermentati TaxID=4955 RepID=A0A1G4M8F6_LACFM|nr:LAFE_0B10110g1_1 [Lachancea fermentati]